MPHSRTSGRPRVCSRTLAARLLAAIGRYDEAAAHSVLDESLAAFGLEESLRHVVLPTLKEVGDGWKRGEIEISQEHFASNLIRGRLLALARFWGRGTGPLALLACAPGEMHDITLLAFALVLRSHSWRILFLGADTPIATLAQRGRDDAAGARRRLELRPRPARGASRRPPPAGPGGAARARRPRRNGRAQRPPRRPPPGRRSRRGSRRGRAGVTVSAARASADPAHGRHRLRRRPAPPSARGARGARALPDPPPGGRRRSPRHDDDRRRRRPRARVPAPGDARGRDRLLPRPFDDLGGELRGAGPSRRRQLRGRGARGGRAPDRLPRRARRRRRSLEPPRRVARKSAASSPTRACRRSSSGPRS